METNGLPPRLLKRLAQIYSINGNQCRRGFFLNKGFGEN